MSLGRTVYPALQQCTAEESSQSGKQTKRPLSSGVWQLIRCLCLQNNAAMSLGRTVHPAFQQRAAPAEDPAHPRKEREPAQPLPPPMPPIHITQVSRLPSCSMSPAFCP